MLLDGFCFEAFPSHVCCCLLKVGSYRHLVIFGGNRLMPIARFISGGPCNDRSFVFDSTLCGPNLVPERQCFLHFMTSRRVAMSLLGSHQPRCAEDSRVDTDVGLAAALFH